MKGTARFGSLMRTAIMVDGRGPQISTSANRHIRTTSKYKISVFADIVDFVNYMEEFSVGWGKAAEYAASENRLFIFVPGKKSDRAIGVYTIDGKHGVLEIYEMAQPTDLGSIAEEFIGRVRNVRSQN